MTTKGKIVYLTLGFLLIFVVGNCVAQVNGQPAVKSEYVSSDSSWKVSCYNMEDSIFQIVGSNDITVATIDYPQNGSTYHIAGEAAGWYIKMYQKDEFNRSINSWSNVNNTGYAFELSPGNVVSSLVWVPSWWNNQSIYFVTETIKGDITMGGWDGKSRSYTNYNCKSVGDVVTIIMIDKQRYGFRSVMQAALVNNDGVIKLEKRDFDFESQSPKFKEFVRAQILRQQTI